MTAATPPEGEMEDIILMVDTTTPQRAREFVDLRLRELSLDHLSEIVRLLTTELVTNAVVSGAGEIRLAIGDRAGTIHVEVDSDQADQPVRHRFAEDPALGRGMAIVEAVATAWGVNRHGGSKTAWFEVSAAQPEP